MTSINKPISNLFDLERLGVVHDHNATAEERDEAFRRVGSLLEGFGFKLHAVEGDHRIDDMRTGKVAAEVYGLDSALRWIATEAGLEGLVDWIVDENEDDAATA